MDTVVANSREMIRLGSRSFAMAAKLFDADTRHHAWMLYAWCRHCDDQIDGQNLGMQTLDQCLTDLVRRNVVAPNEARTKAMNKESFGG